MVFVLFDGKIFLAVGHLPFWQHGGKQVYGIVRTGRSGCERPRISRKVIIGCTGQSRVSFEVK